MWYMSRICWARRCMETRYISRIWLSHNGTWKRSIKVWLSQKGTWKSGICQL